MSNTLFEIRALNLALQTYLSGLGWSGITFKEGYRSTDTITVPTIAYKYLPSRKTPFQLGTTSEKLVRRVIQITAYMESESRADQIIDDIMDFIELTPITIIDSTSAVLGTLNCIDTASIYGEAIPPLLTNPKSIQWRGVVRATLEAYYY